ncbi:hypothetical protein VNO80_24539 [Phaseolus coccineus]|uniref:Uncharacterized protein n=1 Tax=Phaseolus coccineus TaxID=3886 RepID=A0AAN9LXS0_PHACN
MEIQHLSSLFSALESANHRLKRLDVGLAVRSNKQKSLFILSFIKLFCKGKQYCCLSFCASKSGLSCSKPLIFGFFGEI